MPHYLPDLWPHDVGRTRQVLIREEELMPEGRKSFGGGRADMSYVWS